MGGLKRGVKRAWENSEPQVHKQWSLWVLALIAYSVAGLLLVTRIRIPSILHLAVFAMALAVLGVTALRIEWGILALALILPFSRPGVTVGNPKLFHISAMNFAIVGVAIAYVFRYVVDAQFARGGPLIQRTRLDWNIGAFGFLVLLSCLWSFNLNESRYVTMMTSLFLKELVLYILWFYMLVTLLRTPADLRRFAIVFAIAGLMAAVFGMGQRLMGGVGEAGRMEGGLGTRVGGGWFGLGHHNMFAAMLLMTMPIWFFAVSHLKHGVRRLVAEVAVIIGFLGLLFTYSRSAWLGAVAGIGLVGLADRRALVRVVMFGFIFIVIAQTVFLFTADMGLTEVVVNRFEELQGTDFSSRPHIYASVISVIKAHPFTGVGLGAIPAHAPATPMGWVPANAHNIYLAFAAETGLPATFLFALLFARLVIMSVINMRRIGQVPGYGFIALGTCASLLCLVVQTMVVHIFTHRILGYGFYAVAAVVVATDRMIREGQFDVIALKESATQVGTGPWVSP